MRKSRYSNHSPYAHREVALDQKCSSSNRYAKRYGRYATENAGDTRKVQRPTRKDVIRNDVTFQKIWWWTIEMMSHDGYPDSCISLIILDGQ